MAYERLNLVDYTVLKAEHLSHFEDGIEQNANNIQQIKDNGVTDEQIENAVNSYLEQNPIVGQPGKDGKDGEDGQDGRNGVSPVITVTEITGGHRVTITDVNGTQSFDVMDGEDGEGGSGGTGESGADGKDGISPTVAVTEIEGGHRVTIADVNGERYFDVMDGTNGTNGTNGVSATHSWNGTVLTVTSASGTSSADLKGEKGDKGDKGDTGAQGEQGVQGIQGEPGVKGDKGDKGDTGETGASGVSPTVSVSEITGGHEVAITDASGTKTFNVMDGEDGSSGANGTQLTLLWTNASPGSDFAAQTIPLDLSGYSCILAAAVAYKTTNTVSATGVFPVDGTAYRFVTSTAKNRYRDITATDTAVIFSDGMEADTYGATGTKNNTTTIPTEIYGM